MEFEKSDNQLEFSEQERKETIWKNILRQVAELKDKIGGEMDEGIMETVAAFWLHNIPTAGSCEGHIDRGSRGPWIDIEAVDKPKERFNDETVIKNKIANQYNTTPEAIDSYEHREAADKYWSEVTKKGETAEYIKFREQNEKLKEKVSKLLEKFYTNRKTTNEVKLKLREIGPDGRFRIYNGDQDRTDGIEKLTENEKIALDDKLKNRQKEMKDFTEFLKKSF